MRNDSIIFFENAVLGVVGMYVGNYFINAIGVVSDINMNVVKSFSGDEAVDKLNGGDAVDLRAA